MTDRSYKCLVNARGIGWGRCVTIGPF